jgi:hypothetical protein
VIAHHEAGGLFFDRPGRREAAFNICIGSGHAQWLSHGVSSVLAVR